MQYLRLFALVLVVGSTLLATSACNTGNPDAGSRPQRYYGGGGGGGYTGIGP